MGIDYGMGKTNIDDETGIRYGAICCNSLAGHWSVMREEDYGPPTCPRCGCNVGEHSDNVRVEDTEEFFKRFKPHSKRSSADHVCEDCKIYFGSDDAFPEESLGWSIAMTVREETPSLKLDECEDPDEISLLATNLLDNDMLIVKSRYFTFAPFCSPCVPGAGSLDSIDIDEGDEIPERLETPLLNTDDTWEVTELTSWNGNPRTYCLDKEWFENDDCPYPYWEVATGKLVYSPLTEKRRRDLQARVEYLEQLLSSEVEKADTREVMDWLDTLTRYLKNYIEESIKRTHSSPEKQA